MPPHPHPTLNTNFAKLAVFVVLVLVLFLHSPAETAPVTDTECLTALVDKDNNNQQLPFSNTDQGEQGVQQSLMTDILDWLLQQQQQQTKQKRHLFLSDGWGPGGRPLSIGRSDKKKQQQKQQQQQSDQQVMSAKLEIAAKKKQQQQQKHLFTVLYHKKRSCIFVSSALVD